MRTIDQILAPLFPRFKRAPSLVIAGFQKCGTTSLYHYLTQTPYFAAGRKKECNILSDPQYNYLEYLANFPYTFQAGGKHTLCASHQVSYIPRGLDRLKKHLPDIKVVFIMRDPVERAWSRYSHNQRKNFDLGTKDPAFPWSFEELCRMEMELVRNMEDPYDVAELHAKTAYFSYYGLPVTRGLYYTFIKPFYDAGFACHFMSLEELQADFTSAFGDLLDFLELSTAIDFPEPKKYNRSGKPTEVPAGIAAELRAFYAPFNQRLFDFLGHAYDWST